MNLRTQYLVPLAFVAFVSPASSAEIGGRYRDAGTEMDGSKYSGTADITISSDTNCTIVWHAEGGGDLDGICMRGPETLAAAYIYNGRPFLVLYKLEADGTLRGTFTGVNHDSVGTDVLTPEPPASGSVAGGGNEADHRPAEAANAHGSSKGTKPNGTKITTNADGSSIETRSDGTEIVKNANGSSQETRADGTKITTNANGSSVETRSDGTEIVKNANGSSQETRPDGTKITTNANGSSVETRSDGTEIVKNANGSSQETRADGTKITINADGSSIEHRPDGTEIVKNADGSSEETKPDGTKITTNANSSSADTHGANKATTDRSSSASAAGAWVQFRDPDGAFSVEFPQAPTVKHPSELKDPTVRYLFELGGRSMMVQVSDLADEPIVDSKTLTDGAARKFSAGVAVHSDTVVFLDGRRGRSVSYKDKDENEGSVRIFIVKRHLYVIATMLAPHPPSIENTAADEVQRFRDSFHFTH